MKTMHKLLLLPAAFFLFFVAFTFLHSNNVPVDDEKTLSSDQTRWPGKHELDRAFWQTRKLLLVYATGDAAAAAKYRQRADQFAGQVRWLKVMVKPDTAVTFEELTSLPVSLLGVEFSNPHVQQIRAALPAKFESDRFSIPDFFESEQNDVYVLSSYPNPLQPAFPLLIVTGVTEEAVVKFLPDLQNFFLRAGDFKVFRAGQGIILGFFEQKKGGPWTIDYKTSRNYLESNDMVWESKHFAFQFHGEPPATTDLQRLAEKYEERFEALRSRLRQSPSGEGTKLRVHLYESIEDKGLRTGNTDLSHADHRRQEVHAVFNDDLRGTDFFATARLMVKRWAGETKSAALADGLAISFTREWGKLGYRFWAKKFYDTGHANALNDLLDSNIYRKESYLFMWPLAGSFVDFLVEKLGWSKFLQVYQAWPAAGVPQGDLNGANMAVLEQGWHEFLANLPPVSGRPVLGSGKHEPRVFQKGFCYAHEGYQIYNGYLSRKSEQSLAKLRALGTDWISITPFGYLDDRNKPAYLHYSSGAGSENDESVVTAFLAAKKLGMRSMLKPHVLMRSGHFGWPGEVKMKSEADWRAFFKYYTSWIRHYALLAEMYGIDMFCIGTELVHTTDGHDREWRAVVRKIRQIYSGPLVYAANWGEEFEHITFWDELDYIGLNCYYPLSKQEAVTLDELKQGAARIAEKIERVASKFNKPVLLTEVGFTSTARNWQNPHERRRGSPAYFDDQVLCYRAMFETFWDRPWFYGFYWWKWPTYLDYGGTHHSGFTPCGKPAESVILEWYSKERG
ncbi:MAG: hypothetical protein ACE5IY_21770 [bacterium]